MLDLRDSKEVAVSTFGEAGSTVINIETKYLQVDVRQERSVGGVPEVWAKVETRPAFEVALLKRAADGTIMVTLMRKRRKATDSPRTKVPGGYLRGPAQEAIAQKIEQDTGIRLSFDRLQNIGHVIGHSEIVTPIELYWCAVWEKVGEARPGIEVFEVTLDEAARMAFEHEIENDSSFSLIMRLFYLQKTGQLEL